MFSLEGARKIAATVLDDIIEYEEYDNMYLFRNKDSLDCGGGENQPVAVMKKDGYLVRAGMQCVLGGQSGDLIFCGSF